MENKVILTVGLPASGKSSWAKEMVKQNPGEYKRVNKDDLRAMLDCSRYTKGNENFVIKIRDQVILEALKKGKSVIVDDTNIHPKHQNHIKDLVEGKADVVLKDFMHVSVDECVKRDSFRTGAAHVGKKIIVGMYKMYIEYNGHHVQKFPEWEHDLPLLIICDIDGTLSILGDRGPYEIEKSGTDSVNKHVRHLVDMYYWENKSHVELVTGRKEKYRKVTEEWLERHQIPYHNLIMRNDDDNRPDAIVKKEIFEENFQGKYNILFILEDRNRVVEMYRNELCLPVFQVKDGNY
jgi:predicted kinase